MVAEDAPEQGTGGGSATGGSGGNQSAWTGNEDNCPSTAPLSGDLCDVAEGQSCSFADADPSNVGYTMQSLCGCWPASGGTLSWYCYSDQSGPWECPTAQPANGSDCFGNFGASCHYPERTYCSCGSESGWSCVYEGRTNFPEFPPSLDANEPLAELTQEERVTFCAWYVSSRLGEGYP
jgi:hypothetical protein